MSGKKDEPILWFKQTIGHACGSIGLIHCCLNGSATKHIVPGSTFDEIRRDAIPLDEAARAQLLYDNIALETAHQAAASGGDTLPPSALGADKLGQHFVAFVKGDDGRFWELEGGRRGPVLLGRLEEGEGLLDERAVALGLGRVLEGERQAGGGDLRFSVIALVGK